MEQLKHLERLHEMKPELVKLATDTAGRIGPQMRGDGKGPMQGLRTVATGSVCVEEIENWLRYQAGRAASGWQLNAADEVVKQLTVVAGKAKSSQVAEMDAVRLFIGYLVRAVLARRGGTGE